MGRPGSCQLSCIRDGRAVNIAEFWHVVAGKAYFGRPIWRLPDQVVPSTETGQKVLV